MKELKIGALVSGGGSNLQAIIDACDSSQINGQVVFVGSDKPGAYGLERAKNYGIPDFAVDYRTIIKNNNRDFRSGYTNLDLPSDFNFEEIVCKQDFFSEEVVREESIKGSKASEFFLHERLLKQSCLKK